MYSRLSGAAIVIGVWGYVAYVLSSIYYGLSRPGSDLRRGGETGQFDSGLYYVIMGPVMVPVVIVVAYLNWLGIKFFRHN